MQTVNMHNTATFIDHLLPPLLARVKAYKQMPSIAFKDKAAELLIEKLELKNDSAYSHGESEEEHKIALARCIWIDQCVFKFFQLYPHAVGVNLSCGLNTRFHRLSQKLDWPRFRWADIDTAETIAFNQGLLPNIDNYRAIGCDYWREDWLTRTGWKPGTPIIIIMEKLAYTSTNEQKHLFCEYIQQIFNLDKKATVHLILDDPYHKKAGATKNAPIQYALKDLLLSWGIQIDTVGTQNLVSLGLKKTTKLSWLSRLLTKNQQWMGLQISLRRE